MAEQDQYDAPLTPLTVGERLRAAREAVGLSRADVAARTKIAERHLGAIEEDRFDDLASSTYAVGFARAYARTVGLDETEIARLVRGRLDAGEEDVRPAVEFEPGDPARIPTPRLAWLAAAGVVAVIIAIFLFWRSYYTPAVTLPDLTKDEVAAPVAAATAPVAAATAPAPLPSASVGVPLGLPSVAPVSVPVGPASVSVSPVSVSVRPVSVPSAQTGAAPQARPTASPRPAASPSPRPSTRPTAAPSPQASATPPASPAPAAPTPAEAPAEQASTVSQ